MKKIIIYLILLLYIGVESLDGQTPLSQVEGYLEVYHPQDSLSLYIGKNAGQKTDFSLFGSRNTFIGGNAGSENTSGIHNIFLGTNAGRSNTTGNRNTMIGSHSGTFNTIGGFNNFIGSSAGSSNTTGNYNNFLGNEAGRSNIGGGSNVFIGQRAGFDNTSGSNNIFIGSLSGFDNTTGRYNVFVGDGSGSENTIGENNVFVGRNAGRNIKTGSGNLMLGALAGPPAADSTLSNRLYINMGGSTEPLIYGEFDNDIIAINGELRVNGTSDKNSRLRMQGVNGVFNEVIRYDGTSNDVVMGSVSGGGGLLHLRSNSATRMTIAVNGDVGIGTTQPAYKLDVSGDGYFLNDITTGGTINLSNVPVGTSTTDLRIDGSGRVIKSTSDVRFKENIETIPDALSKILKLRGVQYHWKEDRPAGIQLGLIAQEVKEVLPEIVNETDGYYGVDYSETIGVFVEAIKEQQEMIEAQQGEIKELRSLLKSTLVKIIKVENSISKGESTSSE